MSVQGADTTHDRTPPRLHELEAEVMEELWASGEAPVRAVMDAVNKRTSKVRAYTTYMTIMARLHKKGVLLRRRAGKTDFYAPRHGRDEYVELRARSQVEDLVAQYGDVALSNFAQQIASLDPARRRALQRLAREPNPAPRPSDARQSDSCRAGPEAISNGSRKRKHAASVSVEARQRGTSDRQGQCGEHQDAGLAREHGQVERQAR